ncbi:MAG: hypothetical protein BGO05_12410 [Rhizobiales bacterium 63-7]|nr:hypothetical protein [Hyphomicrobiales bacterium]OJU68675.1 MAG: hypothetical protein BGO05_12410 [Rhizobiales bacterium 63-7]
MNCNTTIPKQSQRRGILLAISALIITTVVFPCSGKAQTPEGKIGEIVQPATGTGRAVYAPLDQAVILPRFLGRWAVLSGKCVGQRYTDRMELDQNLAILAGRTLTVQTALVEADPQSTANEAQPPRAGDYADADDLLVGFDRPGPDGPRYIHFRFARGSGRLIVEEVGKPRRAYVRCS